MKISHCLFFVFFLLFYTLPKAYPQSTTIQNTTSTTLDWSWSSIKKRARVEFKTLSGISAAKEDESEFEGKIDYDEAPSSRMLNELAIGYKLSDLSTLSLVGVWSIQPGEKEGRVYEWLDPYVKLAWEELVQKGNFTFSTDVRSGIAVSRESKESNRVLAIASEQEFEYQFGKSPFSIELETFIQYNQHRAKDSYDDVQVRYEPSVYYHFNDNVYGRLAYESQMYHERHEGLRLIDNREPAMQAGVGWQVDNKLHVYPFIDVNLTEPGTKNALYGAQIDWAIL